MIHKSRYYLYLTLCLSTLIGSGFRTIASAAPISYQGVTIAPAIMNLDLKEGQTKATFSITVTNNTKKSVSLSTSSIDFKSLNDSGGVAFITSGSDQAANKYGLVSWMDLPKTKIDLLPNKSTKVDITVENRADLSPGGHYAAVLFKASDTSTGGQSRVDINQVVSSLIFVRKIGGEQYGLSLNKPQLSTSWFHLPDVIDLFIKNTGNVQVPPRGIVNITSPTSHVVSKGILNTDSGLVLPDSTRLYRTELKSAAHAWVPGMYHVHIVYRTEYSQAVKYYDASFLYINVVSLVEAISLLIIVLFIARLIIKKIPKRTPQPPPSKAKKIIVRHD